MPKRKAVTNDEPDESDLSPPPQGLLDAVPPSSITLAPDDLLIKEAPRKRRKVKQSNDGRSDKEEVVPARKRRTEKSQIKVELAVEVEVEGEGEGEGKGEGEVEVVDTVKVKTKRKSKVDKERELVEMPLAARTVGHKLIIGAHVSAAGGVHKAIPNSVHIGANAFALFLKSQRKWENPPLLDTHTTAFHAHCKTHSYDQTNHIVPHGSYLVNLAHTDKTRTAQAYAAFLDDLKRCERLGISLYNFHPGNDQNNDRPKALAHLASNLNRAHAETKTVITLLETMAHGGNTLGSTFADLRSIIDLVHDKSRVGVCIDICHIFAAGYDLRSPSAFRETMDEFDRVVGFKYLKAMHLNDSKAPLGSFKDLHANIGTGFIGLRGFRHIANEPRLAGIPWVLETPIEVRDADGVVVKDKKGKVLEDRGIWAREIKLVEGLVGMDTEGEAFGGLEDELARRGGPERARLLEQIERVKEKKEKMKKGKRKGARRKGEEDEGGGRSGESSPLSDLGDEVSV
ncbi:hypothetical protein LTR62_001208 [Meristemomyces frigidus]|uniref:Apurinic-apyrimidinic endonuclease 1 n=1 Tax=Meristemomyces frigidus TaxID=1508187 RepID=A0AAN7TKJ8_9PEZI|nr:hypothetical protein LTR62_001208 [Meristemomyces frigidus]